ncbi:hypothetical protein [Flaviaesturariibacter amylovorans]|uniref:Lipoprotein n=1 Tax=Flaviaesturariibacter amylovorans TaxID=1084520 RepID=A0ABP8G6F1_9BACT
MKFPILLCTLGLMACGNGAERYHPELRDRDGFGYRHALAGATREGSIRHDYKGCFASDQERIDLFRSDTARYAVLHTRSRQDTVWLQPAQGAALDTFVLRLERRVFEPLLCTTNHDYSVRYRGRSFEKHDGGCQWNGFQELEEALFGKERGATVAR